MSKCSKCKKSKSIKEFYLDNRTGKPRSYCIDCQRIANRLWRKNNPDRDRERNRKHQLKFKLKNIYNLTEEEYNNLVKKSNGRCEICKSEEKLVIDHCHNTKVTRGLLCNNCNTGIGMLKDDIKVLQQAIKYLTI